MKYNIAIIGTFDCENFGDLMFPIVFRKQMEKRLEIDNLFLFSPNECEMPLNPNKIKVYSIDKLEKIHNEHGLNAIVFGGGDLARLDNDFAPTENYAPQNTSFDLMIYSAIVANKYNIPYLWNCPGVPFEFLNGKDNVVKCLLDDFTDYISVREHRSAEILKSCGCNSKIVVSPDTVLSVSQLIDKNQDDVFNALKEEFSFLNDEYIAFQIAINKDAIGDFETFKNTLNEQLCKISEKTGKKVIFLSIGNVHNDDKNIACLLNEFTNENFVTVDRKLNIYETNAVLANANAFIGTSLHGNIVSNSYKVPSIGLNLYDFVKLNNYFVLISRDKYCLKNIERLYDAYIEITSKNTVSTIDDALEKVEAHFDNITDLIKGNNHKKADIKELVNLCYECNPNEIQTSNITVYFDYGEGFDAQNPMIYDLSNASQQVKITLDISANVKTVRIDPADNAFCVVKDLRIFCKNKPLDFNGNYFFDQSVDNTWFFFNKDPQIIFNTEGKNAQVDIQFSVMAFFPGKNVLAVFPNIEETLTDLHMALTQKNNIIAENEKVIEEQGKKINQKDEMIIDCNNRYNNLFNSYTEITNSFYWRLTALPRKITHKIKMFVVKHRIFMYACVFAKGFLRGGFSEGRKRLINYKIFIGRIKVLPYKISQFQRREEEKYAFENAPKFSVLVPLYNTPNDFLKEMIESVQKQTYKNWELCLTDGSDAEHSDVGEYCKKLAAKDNRIKYKKLEENKGIADNTNECLKMATGDYIALFDHDDILHYSALFEYAKVINEKKADFIYCDEATFVSEESNCFKIVLKHHKPEFSPDTLRSYNYICHLTCFDKKLYEIVGGFNKEYDGSQDYDLILRLTEQAQNIVRVPKLLYFWRSHKLSVASGASAKPYVVNSAEKALAAHLERVGLKGTVKESYAPTTYKIDYDIIGNPLVSIIIPNKDHIDDLHKCLNSIIEKSTYNNFEIIVVENNSVESKTFDYYKRIQNEHKNIKVVFWEGNVFNYSTINNFGAGFAKGEYVLLLNNDIEVITPNWLEEMLMFAQREDVGAVGAMLYYPDDTIQHAGVIIGIGGIAGHAHKYFNRRSYGYVSRACISQNLSACTAACLLIRKEVFVEVGGLDESFAVAFNDIDLCMQIRKAGYLIVFTPYAEFYHYESKSRGLENSPEKIARFNGEIKRFKKKWGNKLESGDPYYNPNLTLDREDFSYKI